ncbi:1876_t:CDS:2, partial [Scutellospora calospora]
KIQTNTSSCDSADTIIKQAYILDTNKESQFKEILFSSSVYNIKTVNSITEVDIMSLLMGYSTSVIPSQGLCDNCFDLLNEKSDDT